ncbi:MAG TPA: hydrogenase maturation protease [Terriglobales bacterium]|nr:hydrogenase maturation protease [Terriglobales bacterium]
MNEWEWQLLEDKRPVDSLRTAGAEIKVGHRVRLHPRKGGDVMDLALAGQSATIEAIEQDYEGKCHVCVVVDSDPGRDMGFMRQPGHRFFFDPEEIELLPDAEIPAQAAARPRILVAGIGNIFLGDDGFGVEVVKRLSQAAIPGAVRVVDFGLRGLDLTYALQEGYETTILVDAYSQGQTPGTLFVIEPDLNALDLHPSPRNVVDAHSMNPMNVLRMAKGGHGDIKNVLLVGCEPATLGGEEGHMGLSAPVEAAVDEAVKLIVSLTERFLNEHRSDSIL